MGTSIMSADARGLPVNEHDSLRLSEAEHRHGNTLQILSNLVRSNLREAESEETREVLASLSDLIDTFINLHKLCRKHDPDVSCLLEGMARQWQRLCDGRIQIAMEAEPGLELPRSSQTAILLIAHELVLNAIKHAFPDGRSGTIRIRFRSDDNRNAMLQVEDTGVGAETTCAADTTGTNHGQKLVRDLSFALGGTLQHGQASGGHGRRVTLCLPLAQGARWPRKAN